MVKSRHTLAAIIFILSNTNLVFDVSDSYGQPKKERNFVALLVGVTNYGESNTVFPSLNKEKVDLGNGAETEFNSIKLAIPSLMAALKHMSYIAGFREDRDNITIKALVDYKLTNLKISKQDQKNHYFIKENMLMDDPFFKENIISRNLVSRDGISNFIENMGLSDGVLSLNKKKKKLGKNDILIFYFTGHGFKYKGTTLALSLANSTKKGLDGSTYFQLNSLLSKLGTHNDNLKDAGTIIVFIDSCNNDDKENSPNLDEIEMGDLAEPIIFMASEGYAHIDPEERMGFFTKFLGLALSGKADGYGSGRGPDGNLDTFEIYKYLQINLNHAVKNKRMRGRKIAPQHIKTFPDNISSGWMLPVLNRKPPVRLGISIFTQTIPSRLNFMPLDDGAEVVGKYMRQIKNAFDDANEDKISEAVGSQPKLIFEISPKNNLDNFLEISDLSTENKLKSPGDFNNKKNIENWFKERIIFGDLIDSDINYLLIGKLEKVAIEDKKQLTELIYYIGIIPTEKVEGPFSYTKSKRSFSEVFRKNNLFYFPELRLEFVGIPCFLNGDIFFDPESFLEKLKNKLIIYGFESMFYTKLLSPSSEGNADLIKQYCDDHSNHSFPYKNNMTLDLDNLIKSDIKDEKDENGVANIKKK